MSKIVGYQWMRVADHHTWKIFERRADGTARPMVLGAIYSAAEVAAMQKGPEIEPPAAPGTTAPCLPSRLADRYEIVPRADVRKDERRYWIGVSPLSGTDWSISRFAESGLNPDTLMSSSGYDAPWADFAIVPKRTPVAPKRAPITIIPEAMRETHEIVEAADVKPGEPRWYVWRDSPPPFTTGLRDVADLHTNDTLGGSYEDFIAIVPRRAPTLPESLAEKYEVVRWQDVGDRECYLLCRSWGTLEDFKSKPRLFRQNYLLTEAGTKRWGITWAIVARPAPAVPVAPTCPYTLPESLSNQYEIVPAAEVRDGEPRWVLWPKPAPGPDEARWLEIFATKHHSTEYPVGGMHISSVKGASWVIVPKRGSFAVVRYLVSAKVGGDDAVLSHDAHDNPTWYLRTRNAPEAWTSPTGAWHRMCSYLDGRTMYRSHPLEQEDPTACSDARELAAFVRQVVASNYSAEFLLRGYGGLTSNAMRELDLSADAQSAVEDEIADSLDVIVLPLEYTGPEYFAFGEAVLRTMERT